MRHKLFKFEQSPRGYRFPSTFVRGTAGEAANAEGIIEATHPAQLSVHSIVATAATESQAFSASWWVALVTWVEDWDNNPEERLSRPGTARSEIARDRLRLVLERCGFRVAR